MEHYQKVLVVNGFLVITIAMFAGFMLMFCLIGGLELWPGYIFQIPVYGTEAGWIRAHTGGITNGLLILVVGVILPKLDFSARSIKLISYGFTYVAWSFTIFYWFGNAAGSRALTLGDNPLGSSDVFGVIGFLPALPSVFIVVALLIMCVLACRDGASPWTGRG